MSRAPWVGYGKDWVGSSLTGTSVVSTPHGGVGEQRKQALAAGGQRRGCGQWEWPG
jgi:hypothetical protein